MCWLPIYRGFLKGSPLKPPHGHPPTALRLRFLAATFEDALYVMIFYFVMDFYLLVFRGSRFAWIGLPLDCLPTAPRHDRPKFRDCRLAALGVSQLLNDLAKSRNDDERIEVSQWEHERHEVFRCWKYSRSLAMLICCLESPNGWTR